MLSGLLEADEDDVVLVVCQPDKPKGRGKKMQFPPVKETALKHGIEVIQPKRLKDGVVAAHLETLDLDLSIVVAYGRILPAAIFEAPAHDTINVHASLLPRHRGASPIQHAVLKGDSQAGITLMMLSEAMDEGDMLLKRSIELTGDETGGTLFESLATLGRETLLEGLRLAKQEGLQRTPQVHEDATYAGRLEKRQGQLDLHQPAIELERKVRAFNPWPGTFVRLPDGPLKIHQSTLGPDHDGIEPGQIASLAPLTVQTGAGSLVLEQVQPPGKRAMAAADFLRGAGRHLEVGAKLGE